MPDARTTEQAKATEQRLLVQLTEILLKTERELMECREQLAAARQQLGERSQAREGL